MTRDPTTTSYLPTLLIVRSDLHTTLNAIGAYEQACLRFEWTAANVAAQQAAAMHTIRQRLTAALDRLAFGPNERERMARDLRHLRDERAALLDQLTAARDTIARLTEANARLTEHP